MFDYLITPTENNLLVSYIEELQQENQRLKERIDKAIEYIEENKSKAYAPYGDNEDYDYEICLNEEDINLLLEILKGE